MKDCSSFLSGTMVFLKIRLNYLYMGVYKRNVNAGAQEASDLSGAGVRGSSEVTNAVTGNQTPELCKIRRRF